MSSLVLCVILSALLPHFASAQVIYSGSVSPLPLFTFSWNVTADSLEVELQLDALAWVGFGLHVAGSTDEAMINADIYTANFNDTGSITVDDRWSTEYDYPYTDLELNNSCTYDVETSTISGVQGTQNTVIRFSRKLDTGDADCDVVVENATQLLIFAFGISNEFDYHYGNATQLYINLFTGDIPSTTTGSTSGSSSDSGSDSSITANVIVVIVLGIITASVAIAQVIAAVMMRKRRGIRGSASHAPSFGNSYEAINDKLMQ